MIPQRFANANTVMRAPADMPDCADIHAWAGQVPGGQPVTITCWRPSPEEQVRLALGEPVYLWIYGQGMPPVALGTQDPWEKE